MVNSGKVKGWKRHKSIYQFMTVPEGEIRLVIYDNREDSHTKGHIMTVDFGPNNYILLKMPPMLWYSFKSITPNFYSIISNCTTAPHDPAESETLPLGTTVIPYQWC